MKISYKNLGRVVSAEFELAPLTIICGPNSSGKTYLSYATYSLFKNSGELVLEAIPEKWFKELASKRRISISRAEIPEVRKNLRKSLSRQFTNRAHDYFSLEKSQFSGFQVSLSEHDERDLSGTSTKSEIADISWGDDAIEIQLNAQIHQNDVFLTKVTAGAMLAKALLGIEYDLVFPITSERTGISLFYRELDLNRSRIIDEVIATKNKLTPQRLMDVIFRNTSRYAEPIRDNIDFVRDYDTIISKQSNLFETLEGQEIIRRFDDLLGGAFKADDSHIAFVPSAWQSANKSVPIYIASSAVKSLLLFEIFIKHVATPNSLVVIDEPELNLHPANQRGIAEVIVRLVNCGVHVLLTTHSDWLVRETSARIKMHSMSLSDPDKLARITGKLPHDCISPELVRAYQMSSGGVLENVGVDPKGIDVSSLDQVITDANLFYDKIEAL